jgi:hypothetical protein
VKDILIDFGLPALVLIGCIVLLMAGHDGEVKSILAMSAGWLFKSGYTRVKAKDDKNDALQSKSDGGG